MGETCGTYVREEICVQISVGKPKVKNHLEDLGVEGGISQLTLEKQDRRGWN